MSMLLEAGCWCGDCERFLFRSRMKSERVSIDFWVTCRVDYFYQFREELIAARVAANNGVDCEGGSPMYVTAPWRVTTTARRQSVVREGRGPSLIDF